MLNFNVCFDFVDHENSSKHKMYVFIVVNIIVFENFEIDNNSFIVFQSHNDFEKTIDSYKFNLEFFFR